MFNYDFKNLPPPNKNKQDWHQSKVVNSIKPNYQFTKKSHNTERPNYHTITLINNYDRQLTNTLDAIQFHS